MVEFNRVIDGLLKYFNNNLFAKMNDWQEVVARIAVGRIIGNPESLKQSLMANGIVRTFAVMDSEGNVDLEPIMRDLKREIDRKGKLSVEIPMFGKMSFTAADVDEIYREITGGIL
ncbi:MAG: hypothetical protein IKU42_05900 [Oscillospiraceae bacterium]|nr:hypothetical protein [Oscillospiraceae bacterium]